MRELCVLALRPARLFLLWAVVCSVLFLAACNSGGDGARDFTDAQRQELQAVLDNSLEDVGAPGAVMAVRGPNGDTWLGASGVASVDSGTPMSTDMYFRIGSMTKSFTATLMLLLQEEGMLNLEDTVASWLGKGYYPGADNVTLRQLLDMTSGYADYTHQDIFIRSILTNPRRVYAPEELVSYARNGGEPAWFSPGADWSYSNTNYVMLGAIAEQAAGLPYRSLVQSRILDKLGLPGVVVPAPEELILPQPSARGHLMLEETWLDWTSMSPSLAYAAGNMIATVSGLLDWIVALHHGDLLSEQSRKHMFAYVSRADGGPWDGREPGYGLGVGYVDGAVGHNGEVPGFVACAYVLEDYAFAVLMNGTTIYGGVDDVFWNAARVLIAETGS